MDQLAIIGCQPHAGDFGLAGSPRRIDSNRKQRVLCSEADRVVVGLAIVLDVKRLAAIAMENGPGAFLLPEDLTMAGGMGSHGQMQRDG